MCCIGAGDQRVCRVCVMPSMIPVYTIQMTNEILRRWTICRYGAPASGTRIGTRSRAFSVFITSVKTASRHRCLIRMGFFRRHSRIAHIHIPTYHNMCRDTRIKTAIKHVATMATVEILYFYLFIYFFIKNRLSQIIVHVRPSISAIWRLLVVLVGLVANERHLGRNHFRQRCNRHGISRHHLRCIRRSHSISNLHRSTIVECDRPLRREFCFRFHNYSNRRNGHHIIIKSFTIHIGALHTFRRFRWIENRALNLEKRSETHR